MATTAGPDQDVQEQDGLLDRLFAAIEGGDIDAVGPLYADDVEVWHNVTQRALDKAGSLDLLRFWSSRFSGSRYEVLERHHHAGGAFQRHVLHGTAAGEELAVQVCITFRFAEGRITHIFEYLDAAAVAVVFGS